MSGESIVPPEPEAIDGTRSMELRHLSANAGLRAKPFGDNRCENCIYYLENTADISYCWHPKLRILVGANWSCQWWEKVPADLIAAST